MENIDKKIIIVDDEILSAMNLKMSLNRNGYQQVEIAGIDEGLRNILSDDLYDIALMDINLNLEFDGIDLVRDAGFNGDVIFISGYNKKLFENKLSNINYKCFFEKPLDFNKLLEMI